jgi:formyltetrahydrofolate-dependent phosphoribosylglycinamide formyltransferase
MSSSSPLRLAVLLSGTGRTLQNFIDLRAAGQLDISVELVIASRPSLMGSERACQAGLPNVVADRSAFATAEDFSRDIFARCDAAGAQLVLFAGWLSLLQVPPRYENRIMNIHPALLPSFGGKGMYGHRVHQAVIDHGCKISGCTVHFVDAKYDNGPIIVQRTCPVLNDDTPDALAQRVFEQELIAYPEAVRLFQQDRVRVESRRVRILPEKRN